VVLYSDTMYHGTAGTVVLWYLGTAGDTTCTGTI